MLKEKGYDEYLAEQVKQGLADVKAGRVLSLEQANAEWQAIIEQIERDNHQFEQEIAYG